MLGKGKVDLVDGVWKREETPAEFDPSKMSHEVDSNSAEPPDFDPDKQDRLMDDVEQQEFGDKVCGECGSVYASKEERERHEKSHTDGTLACDICNARFKREWQLHEHAKKHPETFRKSYIIREYCEICKEKFKSVVYLDFHMRDNHSSDYPYKCSDCFIAFNQSSGYEEHMKKHRLDALHAEDPLHDSTFVCVHCGRKFEEERGLMDHKILDHLEEEEYILEKDVHDESAYCNSVLSEGDENDENPNLQNMSDEEIRNLLLKVDHVKEKKDSDSRILELEATIRKYENEILKLKKDVQSLVDLVQKLR